MGPDTQQDTEDTGDVPPDTTTDTEDTPDTHGGTRPYPAGTAQAVVHDLWRDLGHWPSQQDIVEALAAAGLPSSSSQAKKVRRQVAGEVPGLPGLRSAS
jgi:hypothetical protein